MNELNPISKQCAIHPAAVVEEGARIGAGARIGPFCHVGPEVVIGDRVELISHVAITGATTIGDDTRVFPQAVLGCEPQNIKHEGGRTTLSIGRGCTIREGVTIHTGTDTSRARTVVGDNCMLLAYVHIGHDCIVGNNVTMASYSALSGHCEVGDNVNMGGHVGVHQFVRIGKHAFIGAFAGVGGDVIPYAMVAGAAGREAMLHGLNVIGIKRSGFPREEYTALRKAYFMLFGGGRKVGEMADTLRESFAGSATVGDVAEFVSVAPKRYFCRPARAKSGNDTQDDGA